MDKSTLKSVIIGLKLNEMSFADISDKLKDEYGINMSRQAVCGLYNRATSDEAVKNNLELVLKRTDICKYAALGLNSKSIKKIVEGEEFNISIGKIDSIIKENTDYMGEIEDDMINTMFNGLESSKSMCSILEELEYKGVKTTSKKLDYLLDKVVTKIINKRCTEVLAKTFDATGDRDLVRKMISRFNLDLTFRDIGKELNREE